MLPRKFIATMLSRSELHQTFPGVKWHQYFHEIKWHQKFLGVERHQCFLGIEVASMVPGI
jgi:hypothetical protein